MGLACTDIFEQTEFIKKAACMMCVSVTVFTVKKWKRKNNPQVFYTPLVGVKCLWRHISSYPLMIFGSMHIYVHIHVYVAHKYI